MVEIGFVPDRLTCGVGTKNLPLARNEFLPWSFCSGVAIAISTALVSAPQRAETAKFLTVP